jgi:hypothetical protein
VGRPLEIISRWSGKLFLGNYDIEVKELPALATEVKPQKKAINNLKNISGHVLDIP